LLGFKIIEQKKNKKKKVELFFAFFRLGCFLRASFYFLFFLSNTQFPSQLFAELLNYLTVWLNRVVEFRYST